MNYEKNLINNFDQTKEHENNEWMSSKENKETHKFFIHELTAMLWMIIYFILTKFGFCKIYSYWYMVKSMNKVVIKEAVHLRK